MYQALLSFLVERAASLYGLDIVARNVATDFEKASINAFQEVFPQVVVTGCHFHLGQAVIRKVNDLGLKTTYSSNSEFALHTRMLYGMAYLPTAEVPAALEVIRLSMPPAGQPVIEYFDRTYVNGPVLRTMTSNERVHRAPMFPPSMWNVAERFDNHLPTTTNHVEAWHRRLKTLIVFDHPSFFNCLHKLRQEQRHTEVATLRTENGFRRKSNRRSMVEHMKRLTSLMNDLRSGRKDVTAFLRGVGHAFGGLTLPNAVGGLDDVEAMDGEASGVSNEVVDGEPNYAEDLEAMEGAASGVLNEGVVGESNHVVDTTPLLPRRGRRRLRSPNSAAITSPARRRPLRDLPVRRANAASTAALAVVASAAAPSYASTSSTASTASSAVSTVSAASPAPMGPICPVCLVNAADTVIVPCGHCGCNICLRRVMGVPDAAVPAGRIGCPVCRSVIVDIIKLHFAA